MTLSLPPFTKAVTWLLGLNTAVFLLMLLLPLLRLGIVAEYIGYFCEKCCPVCRQKPAAKE